MQLNKKPTICIQKVDIRNTLLGGPNVCIKTELNDYLSKTDATNNYAQKGWATQTFAIRMIWVLSLRKTEIAQYALTLVMLLVVTLIN